MKKNLILTFGLLTAFSAVIFFSACDRANIDNDTSIAADNAFAEQLFADVQNISDQASEGQLTTYIPYFGETLLSGCATVTLDNTSTPKKITVDFGTTNCLCSDNRTRRGKIFITYTGKYRDSGTVINITFENYFVHDNQVMGQKTITNKGKNTNGNLNYDIAVDGKIKKVGGDSVIWVSNRNREWIEGSATPTWWDDVYLITGDATGVSAAGINFDIDITKALRKEVGYKFIVSGTLEIQPVGKFKRILDFGDGTRDNKATVTINNKTYDILLY